MRRHSVLVGLLSLVACVSGSGCSVRFSGFSPAVRESVDPIKYDVASGARLVVETASGSVSVDRGESGSFRIEAEKGAESKAGLDAMKIVVEQADQVVKVSWTTEDRSTRGRQVNFKIRVPEKTNVEVKSKGGSVNAKGLASGLKIDTGGGSISVKDVSGDLELKTGGGSIQVGHADGKVVARTGGGSIDLSGKLSGDSLAKTGGGSVDVKVPESARLKVEAKTGGGSIRNDFGWKATGLGSQSLKGTIGDGSGGTLSIDTGGGSIEIEKSN